MRKHVRHFKGRAFGKLGFCTSWAAHKDPHVAQWLEIVKVPLRIANIADELVGKKIVQVNAWDTALLNQVFPIEVRKKIYVIAGYLITLYFQRKRNGQRTRKHIAYQIT